MLNVSALKSALGGSATASDGVTRLLASGDESGTAAEDRPFRPDVEGLRAVAVVLVVLFHSGVSSLSGGYIGVDVFFVISGFVITGILLRERSTTGRTSILAFYGRRMSPDHPRRHVGHHLSVFLSYFVLGIGAGTAPPPTGGGRRCFCPTSIQCRRDQLPQRPAAPLPPPEFLVAFGGGAVLRLLPDSLPPPVGHAHTSFPAPTGLSSASSRSSVHHWPSRSSTHQPTPRVPTSRRSPGHGNWLSVPLLLWPRRSSRSFPPPSQQR